MINVKEKLAKALNRRSSLLADKQEQGTDCFRLFCGGSEGIDGLVVDQYGSVLIFQVYESNCGLQEADLIEAAKWICRETGSDSVYEKRFVADRSSRTAGEEYYSPKPLFGREAPESIQCRENHLNFEIRPFSGYSTGLFLDQRENRKWLAEIGAQKKVLNLFAYTCGFSVACASKGAQTTSVDLSKKYLEWGKRNFDLNQINTKKHFFVASDTFDFLKQALKKKVQYDLVIVDPPSFSRTKSGKVFSLKQDLEKLLSSVFPILATQGILFFSTNFSEWDSESLKKRSSTILESLGVWNWLPEIKKPTDFQGTPVPLSQWALQKN